MEQENDQVKQQSEQYRQELIERLKAKRDAYRAECEQEHKHQQEEKEAGPAKEARDQTFQQVMRAMREERCA